MKKRKNNLDEMQEKKLLKIEHNGCWIAFWSLFAVIYLQIAIGNGGLERLGGEIAVMLVLSIYLMVSCIRNGIWDRQLKPNLKTNFMISLVTGLVFGIYWFVISYHNYHKFAGSLATFALIFISIGGLSLILLQLATMAYQHKKKRMDAEADREENMD